jgi:hypothetical protein
MLDLSVDDQHRSQELTREKATSVIRPFQESVK